MDTFSVLHLMQVYHRRNRLTPAGGVSPHPTVMAGDAATNLGFCTALRHRPRAKAAAGGGEAQEDGGSLAESPSAPPTVRARLRFEAVNTARGGIVFPRCHVEGSTGDRPKRFVWRRALLLRRARRGRLGLKEGERKCDQGVLS